MNSIQEPVLLWQSAQSRISSPTAFKLISANTNDTKNYIHRCQATVSMFPKILLVSGWKVLQNWNLASVWFQKRPPGITQSDAAWLSLPRHFGSVQETGLSWKRVRHARQKQHQDSVFAKDLLVKHWWNRNFSVLSDGANPSLYKNLFYWKMPKYLLGFHSLTKKELWIPLEMEKITCWYSIVLTLIN